MLASKFSFLVFVLFLSFPTLADIYIIAHPDFELEELSQEQVEALYVDRQREALDAGFLDMIEYPEGNNIRQLFYSSISNIPYGHLRQRWARKIYNNEIVPFRVIPDCNKVIEWVANTQNAIGYILDTSVSQQDVKILYTIHL